jgi:hypothetical protein
MMMSTRSIVVLAGVALAGAMVSALADPPGRVGRISYATGDVAFQNSHTGESDAAQMNWPVTAQNVISTGANGRTEIRIGSTAVRLDGDSEIEFARLDDQHIRIRLLAGRMALRVKNRDKLQELEVRTPHGRAHFDEVGRYRFDTRGERESTGVTVHQGIAKLDTGHGSIVIPSGRRTEVWAAAGATESRSMEALRDEFDDWNLARDRRDDNSRSVQYVSPEMTGYDDLDEHGEWREVAEHGPVWVPHMRAVPADWAPYRWGRWVWVDPWGWTWIDSAPWGFAPFHYGRWVHFGSYWAWAPGVIAPRPVYAPALVGWIGRPGGAVSLSIGPSVGWFPLAPREVYYPYYTSSVTYVRRINVTHVHNVAVIQHRPHDGPGEHRRYHHAAGAHGVTMVSQSLLSGGRHITPAAMVAREHRAALPISDASTLHAPPRPAVLPGRLHGRPAFRDEGPTVQPAFQGRRAFGESGRDAVGGPNFQMAPSNVTNAPRTQMAPIPNPVTVPPANRAMPDGQRSWPSDQGVRETRRERNQPTAVQPPVQHPIQQAMPTPQPRFEQPRFEAPKFEQPRFEQPRFEPPRVDQQRPQRAESPRPGPAPMQQQAPSPGRSDSGGKKQDQSGPQRRGPDGNR